jgi:hypothetical protein
MRVGQVVAVTIGAFAAMAAGAAGIPLGAQVIRGSVVLPDSVTPLAGAIVAAADVRRSGGTAAQALANARGEFVLRLPQAGRYGLRVLRIGYRPTVGPTVDVGATDTVRVRIVFRAEAVMLSAVNVRDKETCRVGADSGMMVARVWEEARKAMLSSQLSSDDVPLVADWIEYDRMLDSSGRLVRSQRVKSASNPTTHAFKSLPADQLADKGYVVADNSGTTFYAPDADVLLSDSFASTHCFHLRTSPVDAHLIGVGFTPSPNHRDAHDIEGVLWLDRQSAELETLEFDYTNLPDVVRSARAGGRVEFLRLTEGSWLVSRWSVRMPQVEAIDRYPGTGTRKVIKSASPQALGGVQVTGGEVNRISRHDTLIYRQAGPHVAVQVLARDSLMRPANARLRLAGTDYVATGDEKGRIDLTPVLAGTYRARLSTPLMDSLGMPPVEHEVEAVNGLHVDSVFLPRSHDALSTACPRDSIRNGEGMLHGRVRDERDRPIAGAAVTTTWQTNFAFVPSGGGNALTHREQTLGALTDDNGYWRLCGVPREQAMFVSVATDSGSDVQKARLNLDQDFAGIDLILHQRTSNAAHEAALVSGVPPRTTASVEIEVARLGGDPLPETNLEVIAGGQTRRVATGPTGRALLPEVEPGKIVVRARHVGYTPGDVVVTIAPGRNMIPILMSSVTLPMLDTVRIVAQSRTARIDRHFEFDERLRMHAASAAFTKADIDKRGPVDAWQMLTNVPGVKIIDSGATVTAESTRGMKVMPDLSLKKCYLMVLVDGMELKPSRPTDEAFNLNELPKPNEIHGIEVFDGPASIPLQYGGAGKDKWCGMIMIWTR